MKKNNMSHEWLTKSLISLSVQFVSESKLKRSSKETTETSSSPATDSYNKEASKKIVMDKNFDAKN